jgi:type II secretory pathway pseudopilin PulG
MKPFRKSETLGLVIIFLVLIAVSIPNFVLSLRRARDQVRRDDMGALVQAFSEYITDFGEFPPASADGKIMNCKNPEDTVTIDKKGRLVVKLIPCEWGKDAFFDLTPGSSKVYMSILPQDPDFDKGVTYRYHTDGARYQLFAYMEGEKDEAEYDQRIVDRGISCGTKICNVGREYDCPIEKTISQCTEEALGKRNNIVK